MRPIALVGAIAAIAVLVDQVTKSIAASSLDDGPIDLFWTLRLNLVVNRGAAFSVGPGFTGLITVIGIGLLAALLLIARRIATFAQAIALGLVVGGAAGNLWDRLFRDNDGAVIDFIDFQWWPVFNVADIALFCGAALLIWASWRE